MNKVVNGDCMDFMKEFNDGYFDLALVDPPYGLPKDSVNGRGKLRTRALNSMDMKWDTPPNELYFKELFRVSKNQIIWGGNYFQLPATRGILIWDKEQPFPNFSAFEYAWTSFNKPAKIFRQPTTRTGEHKIHPTQKSVKLYEYCLRTYLPGGGKVLDSHIGSGSSMIAAYNLGYDFYGSELSPDYFASMEKRFQDYIAQGRLFEP